MSIKKVWAAVATGCAAASLAMLGLTISIVTHTPWLGATFGALSNIALMALFNLRWDNRR